jgi:hypothetical protein
MREEVTILAQPGHKRKGEDEDEGEGEEIGKREGVHDNKTRDIIEDLRRHT